MKKKYLLDIGQWSEHKENVIGRKNGGGCNMPYLPLSLIHKYIDAI